MNVRRIILPDGTIYNRVDDSEPVEILPIDTPTRGLFLYTGDGQQVLRVLDDMHGPAWGYQSRTFSDKIKLSLTNATMPFWFIDENKNVISWYPIEQTAISESKTICRLDLEANWLHFMEWSIGIRNLVWIVQPGTGYADTDAENTVPYRDPVKWQSLDFCNNLRLVVPNPDIPSRYVQVQVLDYYSPPTYNEAEDCWYYKGEKLTIEDTPHLLVVQTLVGDVKKEYSYGPIADKGYPGGAGKIITPAVMKYPAVHERQNVYFYPDLPITGKLYPNSLVIEGEPNPQTNAKQVTIDALCFTGFKVLGGVKETLSPFMQFIQRIPLIGRLVRDRYTWYTLENMLMRGSSADKSLGGTWRDWEIFFDYGGKAPPNCLPPDIGWVRDYVDV